MKTLVLNISMVVLAVVMTACGSNAPVEYSVDAEKSVLNWKGYEGIGSDDYHAGTVSFTEGTATLMKSDSGFTIQSASATIDMNSIKEENAIADLEGHLKSPDFFDANAFATATFSLTSHENGAIKGNVTIKGIELAIEAPVTIAEEGEEVVITVSTFNLDVTALNMPYYAPKEVEVVVDSLAVEEVVTTAVEEVVDTVVVEEEEESLPNPVLEFSASIVLKKK